MLGEVVYLGKGNHLKTRPPTLCLNGKRGGCWRTTTLLLLHKTLASSHTFAHNRRNQIGIPFIRSSVRSFDILHSSASQAPLCMVALRGHPPIIFAQLLTSGHEACRVRCLFVCCHFPPPSRKGPLHMWISECNIKTIV